jgi:hypothetical protein
VTRRALKKERLHARVISSLQLRHLAIDKVNVDWSDSVAGVRTGAKITRERCASTQNHRFCVGEPTVPTAATYLDELNPEQRRAVEHGVTQGCTVGPPHLVIAGAGSGKTSTLAHRVAHLVVCAAPANGSGVRPAAR